MTPLLQTVTELYQELASATKNVIRSAPMWVAVMIALSMAAGATAGVVLSSEAESSIPITVQTAVVLSTPSFDPASSSASTTGLQSSQRKFSSVSDDGTKFSAAAEVFPGDSYTIRVPVGNKSVNDLVGELKLVPPVTATLIENTVTSGSSTITTTSVNVTTTDITIDTYGFGVINDVVQVYTNEPIETQVVAPANGGAGTSTTVWLVPKVWKFTLDASAATATTTDGVDLGITIGSGVESGFYTFEGTIKTVSH